MNTSPLENLDVVPVFNTLNVNASDSATAAGGTAAQNHWTPFTNTQVLGAKITYVAHDTGYVSEIVVEQAQDNIGTGLKTICTYTLTNTNANLQGTPDAINAAGQNLAVNVLAEQMDRANGYQYVRVRIVQTGGTATNTFTMTYLKGEPRFSYLLKNLYTLRLPQDQQNDQGT